jgi:hypothetical protein
MHSICASLPSIAYRTLSIISIESFLSRVCVFYTLQSSLSLIDDVDFHRPADSSGSDSTIINVFEKLLRVIPAEQQKARLAYPVYIAMPELEEELA